jgi:head-tail adaptor
MRQWPFKEVFLRVRRTKIEVLRRIETRRAFGEIEFVFEKVCSCWAHIEDGNIITTKYIGELFPFWRVKVGESVFEVISVVDKPGKTRLVEIGIRDIQDGGRRRPCPPSEGVTGNLMAYPRTRQTQQVEHEK